ncbi:MAG: transglutaminase-like domain-containing protein [Myxococcota bacterium]|nr:transglutaminase-like domain-containing protein [Myxococcota bacterium]
MTAHAPGVAPHRAALVRLLSVHGRDLPLDHAAALMAAEEQSDSDPAATLAGLDGIARNLHVPEGASVYERVARLSHALFEVRRFAGDTDEYDAPRNSFLDRVLERRRGLPILLCVVFMEVGRRVGVDVDGISFPGHFVVAPRGADPRFYVDPFNGGRVLRDADLRDHLAQTAGTSEVGPEAWRRFTNRVDSASILQRMNNNLKRSWARRGDLAGALRAVDRNLVIEPDSTLEIRDRGMLLAQRGRLEEGIRFLEKYLEVDPEAWDAPRIQQALRFLRRRA